MEMLTIRRRTGRVRLRMKGKERTAKVAMIDESKRSVRVANRVTREVRSNSFLRLLSEVSGMVVAQLS